MKTSNNLLAGAAVGALAFGMIGSSQLPAQADILHNDDVIIFFSLCVGNDCVNGESFGFDTVRLKENNTRLHFLDTSSTASFPSNDWRIVANDSTNGGLNYLGIEDATAGRIPFRVEAGARANALYVENDGDVGLGTNNPVVNMHIVDGNTPTVRLEQDGSSGFTPQTWDVAGNEAGFFIRDATNGSLLSLRIRPGAPAESIDIQADGDVRFDGRNGSKEVIIDSTGGAGNYAELQFQKNGVADASIGVDNANFYLFSYAGVNDYIVNISNTTGLMTVEHGLTVNGGLTVIGGCTGCDAVFQEDWPLESIDEHAKLMYANSYLPGVGPTPEGQTTIDVFQKVTGILQELEKAHIYIDQLHQRIAKLETH